MVSRLKIKCHVMPGASNRAISNRPFFKGVFLMGAATLNNKDFPTILYDEHLNIIDTECPAVTIMQIDQSL
jgi:hypothetical protein